jgi:hypothetical protein
MMESAGSSRPQFALFGASAQDLVALAEVGAVAWLTCRHDRDQVYEFASAGQTVLWLDLARPVFDLPDLVAILGLSDRDGLDRLAASWQGSGLPGTVVLEWIGATGAQAILPRALYHVARMLAAERGHAGRMALELATYRREFERMQHDFTGLEAYVTATEAARVRDVFDYPPSGTALGLGRGPDGAAPADGVVADVEQLLPLNSLGVAALSMALGTTPGRAGGTLLVTLAAIETGQTLASWSLDPSRAAAGWTELALERAIDEPALSLVLAIRCPPGAEGWTVMLGPPHPYAEFCARTGSGESLGAPLALRVQATLPGTRVPLTTAAVPADGSARPDSCPLTEATLETVSEVIVPPAADGGTSVHYDRDAGFIQVHPRGGGAVTVGRLLVTPPGGTWRLSAQIRLAHERANPAEFAVLVRLASLGDPVEIADGTAGFSGWVGLSAMQRGSLSAVLPEHGGRALAVYLLTRQEGRPEYAWARFSDLRLHYLPTEGRRGASPPRPPPKAEPLESI